ncbi:hypothetical protein DFS34DRAFT_658190 [Phlyctochytrium arcticum]|nr:hypothetical protein DFS34DRAFT_658190 [Phlyctochytrium arcticum]
MAHERDQRRGRQRLDKKPYDRNTNHLKKADDWKPRMAIIFTLESAVPKEGGRRVVATGTRWQKPAAGNVLQSRTFQEQLSNKGTAKSRAVVEEEEEGELDEEEVDLEDEREDAAEGEGYEDLDEVVDDEENCLVGQANEKRTLMSEGATEGLPQRPHRKTSSRTFRHVVVRSATKDPPRQTGNAPRLGGQEGGGKARFHQRHILGNHEPTTQNSACLDVSSFESVASLSNKVSHLLYDNTTSPLTSNAAGAINITLLSLHGAATNFAIPTIPEFFPNAFSVIISFWDWGVHFYHLQVLKGRLG